MNKPTRILVISDSHGDNKAMEKVISIADPIDVIIHLGDICGGYNALLNYGKGKDIYAVAGNNDWDSALPESLVININGAKIFASHGHLQSVYFSRIKLAEEANKRECIIALYGHTHIMKTEDIYGVQCICPGTVSKRQYRGTPPSYVIIELEDNGSFHIHQALIR